MRISIIGSRGYPHVYSGYETFISELAPRLIAKGHEVTVYCHSHLFPEKPKEVNGIQLVYVPTIRSKSLAQLSSSLLATIHAIFSRADIVFFVNSANGPFGLLCQLARKKCAINVDGLEWKRPKWKGIGSRYFRIASYLSTKFFDLVVTDSDRMADIYRAEFGRDTTTIAYGAYLTQSKRPEVLGKFGLTPREYYLVVGRLVPDNNADLVVKGFEKSATARKLVIVGGVPYKDEFASRVQETHDTRIVFTGYIRDPELLNELYCNAYVYIHGHEHGGTNPTLLTGLGSGCCIVALDTVFSREVLDDDAHGLYFIKQVPDFTRAIDRIDRDPVLAVHYREKAGDRIRTKYTWDPIAAQYEDAFRVVLADA